MYHGPLTTSIYKDIPCALKWSQISLVFVCVIYSISNTLIMDLQILSNFLLYMLQRMSLYIYLGAMVIFP